MQEMKLKHLDQQGNNDTKDIDVEATDDDSGEIFDTGNDVPLGESDLSSDEWVEEDEDVEVEEEDEEFGD